MKEKLVKLKYITTQEFNKLATEDFTARYKQSNLT